MNNVNLIGRLTKDASLHKTQEGKSVASFTLAVDGFNDKADFISCVAWEKRADVIAQYCRKGSQIGVTGRLATRNYKDKDDKTVYVTEVVVERVDLIEPKEKGATSQANGRRDEYGNKVGEDRTDELENENLPPDEEETPF